MLLPEREQAFAAVLQEPGRRNAVRTDLIRLVARSRSFRAETIERWTDAKLASWAAKVEGVPAQLAWHAIVTLHLTERRLLLTTFLDAAGLPHRDGEFIDGMPPDSVGSDSLICGAEAIRSAYPLDDVVFYLLSLRTGFPDAFSGIDAWLVRLAGGDRDAHLASSIVTEIGEPHGEPDPPTGDDQLTKAVFAFTTLDRRLIKTVIDCSASVIGAASIDEIDDLLLELEQLNSSRHQTFFHTGFRDALFERQPAQSLPAENDARRRWYWAGYVSGLARQGNWETIASLFDAHQSIGALGVAEDGTAAIASDLVFSALRNCGRMGEAAAFAKEPAARVSSRLRAAMLDCAASLIRFSRAHEARPLLETLAGILPDDPAVLDGNDLRFFVGVQRRRALCLRQLGEQQAALVILRSIVDLPEVMSGPAVHTDIGMVLAGYRRLGEIALPPEQSALDDFIEALGRGEQEFLEAAKTRAYAPAHANYALGVLALAKGNFPEAAHRLDSAHAYISGMPEIYSLDGTLGLTQLYLGVSLCLGLEDYARLPRARELIIAGLDAGARIPVWLVRSTIDSLALARADLAPTTAADVLHRCGDEVLDELIASAGAESPAVRLSLFARAAHPSRPDHARAADYRAVLPGLIAARETEKAADALNFLEQKALAGTGREAFVVMLEDAAALSPAWDEDRVTEARVRLLEVDGRFADAALEVERVILRLVGSGDVADLDNAELLLDVLEDYGISGRDCLEHVRDVVESRVRKRDACAADSIATTDGRCDLRILVVGGSDVQAKMDEDIVARVREELPHVSLDFLHSGWSSSWKHYVDEFDAKSGRADGVVFLQLMRTTFGRTVRARCHLPWRGCRGRGQGEIVNAVKRVVPAARARLLAMSPSAIAT